MNMHREVIKWIQSLDLSFQIKNPRRDLANGFVVAEILSRYNKDVAMHAIDTGMGMAKRLDNWQQIQKYLTKMGCATVTWDMMQGTMEGKTGIGNRLLETLFTFVTKKTLQASPFERTKDALAVPAYQRPTAAKILRDISDPSHERVSKLTGDIDENKRLHNATTKLEEHKQVKLVEREIEPDRFTIAPKTSRSLNATNATSASVGGQSGVSTGRTARPKQIVTTATEVRAVDTSVLQAFADRDAQEKEMAFRAGFDERDDLSYSLSRVVQRPLGQYGLLEELDGGDEPGDYFNKFIARRDVIPADIKEATWMALSDAAQNVAKLLAVRSDEAVHLTSGLHYIFGKDTAASRSTHSADVGNGLALLSQIGERLFKINSDAASTVCERHIVPASLVALATGAPSMVESLATVCASFINCNHRDSLVLLTSWLEPTLNLTPGGQDRFYTAVYVIFSRTDFALCFGGSELCARYATAALHSSSPASRVVGLMLLRLLVIDDFLAPVELLNQVLRMASDPSWEVRINVIDLLGSMHQHFLHVDEMKRAEANGMDRPASPEEGQRERDDTAFAAASERLSEVQAALEQAFASFTRSSSINQRLALRTAAPFLDSTNHAAFSDAFAQLLYDQPMAQRMKILQGSSPTVAGEPLEAERTIEALPGRGRPFYPVGSIHEVWYGPAFAQCLVRDAPNRSTFEFLSAIEPVLLQQPIIELGATPDFWLPLFLPVKSDIMAPIFDPANVRNVAEKDLATCAEMSYGICTRLYMAFSGDESAIDGNPQDVQELAVDWVQAHVV